MDVDFGSIEITTNATGEVAIDVVRKIWRHNKADEEQFLRERLPGYTEYQQKVRHRLVPRIW